MPTISTLGGPSKRTQFSYEGSVKTGVTLNHKVKARGSAAFFQAILQAFKGKTVPGGFSMTNPHSEGFGAWVDENSKKLNGQRLTPRHASFIAAILVHEGYATRSLKGNVVYLRF